MRAILYNERLKVFFAHDGIIYTRTGWLGCQLESTERKRVPAGTTRRINGQDMKVFSTTRKGLFRFRTTWSIPLSCDLEEANQRIREFDDELRNLI